MKKIIIVVSLILILCSIFLFGKDTIMNNTKKLTADVADTENAKTPLSNKPTVLPNANDIDVYMFCDSYTSTSNHFGNAGFLSNHTDKWSLGEVVSCDWMDGYDWFCPLNMDTSKWTSFYNRNYGTHLFSMYGHGYSRTQALNNTIPTSELGFYWDGTKWHFYQGYLHIIMTEYSSRIDYKVVHEYYTDGELDGNISETLTNAKTGTKIYPDNITKKNTYMEKSYEYKSGTPNPLVCIDDVTGNVITLRYERHERYNYTVTYTDGVAGETVFSDQGYEGLKSGDSTPSFVEIPDKTQVLVDGTVIPIREGYTFQGWSPSINPIIEAADADENGEIIYKATWQEDSSSILENLKITKTASTKTPLVGEEFMYTIEIYNQHAYNTKVDVLDVLPSSLTMVGIGDGGIEKDGVITWEDVTIPGADSKEIELYVKANQAASIENTATIHLNNLTKPSNTEIVTPVEPSPAYTVIYKDESNSFSSQMTYELQEGNNTPKFKEELGKTQVLEDGTVIPIREGYRFVGWSKKINKVVSAEDANENYEIIYVAMWQKMSETTDKEEAITPPEDKNSNEIEVPLTEDKIIKYLISGIVSTLLIIIIISKNKRTIKIN